MKFTDATKSYTLCFTMHSWSGWSREDTIEEGTEDGGRNERVSRET